MKKKVIKIILLLFVIAVIIITILLIRHMLYFNPSPPTKEMQTKMYYNVVQITKSSDMDCYTYILIVSKEGKVIETKIEYSSSNIDLVDKKYALNLGMDNIFAYNIMRNRNVFSYACAIYNGKTCEEIVAMFTTPEKGYTYTVHKF